MKILITGGLGNIGQHIVKELLDQGEHSITIFDLKNKINENAIRDALFQNVDVIIHWGNITKPETYPNLSEFDAIIHLAFILPPTSETLPIKITENVNVNGTKNLIDAAKNQGFKGKFIFSSSVSLFGPTMWSKSPITVFHSINPSDVYTSQKAICEEYLQNSGLRWLIFRLSAAMSLKQNLSPNNIKIMYSIPYNQRTEFVHPADAALAFSNAVTANVENEILIIGGGKRCQMLWHVFIDKFMTIFKLPPPDPKKFTTRCYYIDYYDTKRSQELLQYQTRTIDDFIEDFREKIGITGEFVRAFAPIAKFFV